MTLSKFKEQFARAGRVRAVDRVASGSPVAIRLAPNVDAPNLRTVDATLALARRGLTMLRAKRAVETAMDVGAVSLTLPTVEDIATLGTELGSAGFAVSRLIEDAVDVGVLRRRLGLTQDQFAQRYNLDLATVQNWEQGRSRPDRAANCYLRVIASEPEVAERAQVEPIPAGS